MTGYQDIGRYEFKYTLPLSDRDRVMEVIAPYTRPDPHADTRDDGLIGYFNHSIYLDTEDLFDYHERLDECAVRNRLRVRTYGRPGDGAPVFLENKRKLEAWVVKQRVRVGDADSWARHTDDRPWVAHAAQVEGRGRYAAEHFVRLVERGERRPVSAVHYFREVFIDLRGDARASVRLTMDREITGTVAPDARNLYAAPDVELLPSDWMVMELKYRGDRPGWMRILARVLGLRAVPVPKFGLSVARGLRADHPRDSRHLLPPPIRELGWGL